MGRLKPGVSLEQAQTAVTTLFRNETIHGAKPLFKEADDPEIQPRDVVVVAGSRKQDILRTLGTVLPVALLAAAL